MDMPGSIRDIKDLDVWQRAMDLAVEVYAVVKRLPRDEQFLLGSQLRRAAVSVPSNISEGYGRRGRAEFIRFLAIAQSSAREVETQLMLAERVGVLAPPATLPALELCRRVLQMLTRLIQALKRKGLVNRESGIGNRES